MEQATWDLRSKASPRSLCVYTAAATSQETNPFEVASGESHAAQAVVFGTERGSLHYRTYAPPSRGNNRSDLSSLAPGASGNSSSHTHDRIQPPLGITPSGRPPVNLPRAYFPVDLAGGLPGIVVAVVHATTSPSHRPVFMLLLDDNRGTSAAAPGAYAAILVTLQHGSFSKITPATPLPRISCATFHPNCGFVCAAGRSIHSVGFEVFEGENEPRRRSRTTGSTSKGRVMDFSSALLPTPGARGGQDSVEVTSQGKVVVIAVGNSVYAVSGSEQSPLSLSAKDDNNATPTATLGSSATEEIGPTSHQNGGECVKVASFAQSSQVHPVIVLDLKDKSMDPEWSCLFLSNGRECGIIDLHYGPASHPIISCGKARNGMVTLASPILAAASSWPWLAVLTSDGLISVRSPSCLAIPLKTVEVGTRPNDFFVLRTLRDDTQPVPWIMAISYSGEGKVLQCQPDSAQDLADRLMRHSIDAFGANGFPRSELAEAVHASFTATSYVGPEPTAHARDLLRQYLEAVLGLADFDGGGSSGWPTEMTTRGTSSTNVVRGGHHGVFDEAGAFSGRGEPPTVVSSTTPPALVSGTALLCLVCSQLSPPKASLANRAAKACAAKVGVIVDRATSNSSELTPAAVSVCEIVADRLLREANQSFSLLTGAASAPNTSTTRAAPFSTVQMDFVEAATWLLRSAGKHQRAIDVLYERIQNQRSPSSSVPISNDRETSSISTPRGSGFWSQIKYESYTATHLSELWATRMDEACRLVLSSPATYRLLEHNPRLGLSVFTSMHPQSTGQWKSMMARDDPLAHPTYPSQVVKLLKSINPAVPIDGKESLQSMGDALSGSAHPRDINAVLPLESGRALAVTFLESAIGISTGRPTEEDEFDSLAPDENFEERVANFHDELCYLLLEGVISERGDDDNDTDTELGSVYRLKLRRLLRWPLTKVRSERLLNSLPKSFLQEQALVLGRLERHEDALRILYCELQSMELALEYCDLRHERQEAKRERERARLSAAGLLDDRFDLDNPHHPGANRGRDCAYLPLVRVALESDNDSKRGTTAAIQVLALRRGSIDRAAALRLLPKDVPVSAVARPFLIPALVDSESQVRRLTVVSALLRSRYVALKQKLTDAQLKAQENLHVVPQLRSLNLDNPLHSTKPIKARPSSSASTTFPDVVIVKHFFPRHVVIQAKVTNSSLSVDGRALGSVAFVVAESSEEAIQPSLQVPIKVLPYGTTGSTWCVLSAVPQRMEGTAILTCELRYTVLAVDATTGAPLSFGVGNASTSGRTFVEELQDLEVFASHFS